MHPDIRHLAFNSHLLDSYRHFITTQPDEIALHSAWTFTHSRTNTQLLRFDPAAADEFYAENESRILEDLSDPLSTRHSWLGDAE